MTSTPMPARASGARSSGDGNTWREPVPMMMTSGFCSRSRSIVETLKSSGLRSVKSVEVPSGPTMTVPVIVISFTVTNPTPYALIRCPPVVVESEWSFMSTPRNCRRGMERSPVRRVECTERRSTGTVYSPMAFPVACNAMHGFRCALLGKIPLGGYHPEGTGPEADGGGGRGMTRLLRVRVRTVS